MEFSEMTAKSFGLVFWVVSFCTLFMKSSDNYIRGMWVIDMKSGSDKYVHNIGK